MKALSTFVVIQPGEKAKERKGILLPESVQEDPTMATVVAVGPDVTTVAEGDAVLIPLMTQMRLMHSGGVVDFFIDERPALVVKEEDIAVVWPKNE